MANRLNKQGIATGLIVSASHVYDIIDALSFSSSVDILISASLCVGTSASGSDKVKVLGNVNVLGPITASNLNISGLYTGSTITLSGPITASNISSSNWSSAYFFSLQSWVSSSVTGTWDTAYNKEVVSASFSGSTTKTLFLGLRDGTALSASFINTGSGLISGSNVFISMFSTGSRPLIEAPLKILGNALHITTTSFFEKSVEFDSSADFKSSCIFEADAQFLGKIEKPLARVTSDSNYTVVNDVDYFIVLDVQITANRSLLFSGSNGNVPPQELTIINLNTTPFSWSFANDGASSIAVNIYNYNGSAIVKIPTGSMNILRYISSAPNFSYVLKNYMPLNTSLI